MRGHKYRSAWGSYVQFLLDSREWAHADLANKLGIAQGQVSNYIIGRSKPPLGELTKWCEVMRCSRDEQERMLWLALETWTPAPVWARIRELEELIRNAEASLAALAAEIADLRASRGDGRGQASGTDQQ